MARLRGGSPKNMRQGQYWVRRHLDDQRRLAAAQRRVLEDSERQTRASQRAAVALQKEERAQSKRDALTEHFEKVQTEIDTMLAKLTAAFGSLDGKLALQVDDDSDLHRTLVHNQNLFNELSRSLSDGSISLSATSLKRHVQNAKRMLTTIGKALGVKTNWDAETRVLKIGDFRADFSEPTPIVRDGSATLNYATNERDNLSSSAGGVLWLVGSLVVAFGVLVVIAGFITGWQGVGETLTAAGALLLILLLGVGFFGGRS